MIEESAMSFLRRRADASVAVPGPAPEIVPEIVGDTAPETPRRLTRAERKALKAEQAAAAELAARVARAQRRLAQATGPLPVVPQRRSPENAVPSE
ncbi:hypothetical protein [Actinomycetospora aeridis]|uniref:Uncharacterized protein n=1 Tax=Actinomycetospora aeridis TaxID=3129231 RepID=A0ABU8N840_9PSEU